MDVRERAAHHGLTLHSPAGVPSLDEYLRDALGDVEAWRPEAIDRLLACDARNGRDEDGREALYYPRLVRDDQAWAWWKERGRAWFAERPEMAEAGIEDGYAEADLACDNAVVWTWFRSGGGDIR